METAGSALPEFDDGGDEAVAAPEVGKGDFFSLGKFFTHLGIAGFEVGPVWDCTGLLSETQAPIWEP